MITFIVFMLKEHIISCRFNRFGKKFDFRHFKLIEIQN